MLFAAGCDQSVLAPLPTDTSHASWSEIELTANFSKNYSGAWNTPCFDTSPGGARLHFIFGNNEGSATTEFFEKHDCKKFKRSFSRSFSFKVIDAWKYNFEKDFRFVLNIIFDKSADGEISQYDSTISRFWSGFSETGEHIKIMQSGREVSLQGVTGGYSYIREEPPK